MKDILEYVAFILKPKSTVMQLDVIGLPWDWNHHASQESFGLSACRFHVHERSQLLESVPGDLHERVFLHLCFSANIYDYQEQFAACIQQYRGE